MRWLVAQVFDAYAQFEETALSMALEKVDDGGEDAQVDAEMRMARCVLSMSLECRLYDWNRELSCAGCTHVGVFECRAPNMRLQPQRWRDLTLRRPFVDMRR
jgi:hypothetical protein